MTRRGFTLVEILIAMVVLEVGLLAVCGTLWLAARTLTRAEALERAVAALEGVYDSLAAGPSAPDGARSTPRGRVVWTSAGVDLHLVFLDTTGDTVASLDARVPPAEGGAP
jgi:prepilin-type N-terminal cleavage/methylation domain-containing protein